MSSSTRRATEGSPFRQERFASAPEFERGLMANLVAKRCTMLEKPEDRRLIWFLQLLSHQDGGLKKVAADLIRRYPARIATPSMQKFGFKAGQIYSAAQVRLIREEMGSGCFPLKGEIEPPRLDAAALLSSDLKGQEATEAPRFPSKYPAEAFVSECSLAAAGLEEHLMTLCLNPAMPIKDGPWIVHDGAGRLIRSPWYFPQIVSTLREFQADWIAARQPHVVTAVGEATCSALEYAIARGRLVVIDGAARIGKTTAAKTWCHLNPGSVRYVECPASNDEISFFRAIALSLGVSVNQNSKAQDLRMRIEETMRSGDMGLVIDEAHYLWPQQRYYRASTPVRINWIMTALVNHGVGVALITTPQFFRHLSALEQLTCWTSDQFKGRIGRYIKLPDILSRDELEEVAAALLPAANTDSIRAVARYAESSGKYLGAMDAIADTAKYFCESDGRQKVEFSDVERAIRESVTPSDEALKSALAGATATKKRRVSTVVAAPLQDGFRRGETPLRDPSPARRIQPAAVELTAD